MKRLWSVINEILKKERNKSNVVNCLTIDGIKTYDSSRIAKEFRKHFSLVGKVYTENTKQSVYDINHYNKKIDENAKSMFLNPINELEINKLIDSLKRKNSSGYDDISNSLLKNI